MDEESEIRRKRSSGASPKMEQYSPERMEKFRRMIEDAHEDGEPQFYAISVDDVTAVRKTSDPEKFDNYLAYVDLQTEYIEVRLYHGESFNHKLFRLYMRQMALNGAPQLGIADVNEKIQDVVARQELKTQLLLMDKDKTRLEEEKAQLQQDVANLRKKLKKYKKLEEELRANKIDLNELLSKGVELFGAFQAKKNGVPVQVQGLPSTPVEVEIEQEKTEAEKHFEELKSEYSDRDLTRAMQTMELFAKHPELRGEFHKIITSKINNDE